jgi:hypothetical protein
VKIRSCSEAGNCMRKIRNESALGYQRPKMGTAFTPITKNLRHGSPELMGAERHLYKPVAEGAR